MDMEEKEAEKVIVYVIVYTMTSWAAEPVFEQLRLCRGDARGTFFGVIICCRRRSLACRATVEGLSAPLITWSMYAANCRSVKRAGEHQSLS